KVIEAVKEEIVLKNLTTQHTRAEDIKGRKFDFVVSRAVAPLKDLWRWGKPLLRTTKYKVGSSDEKTGLHSGLICLKGGDLKHEIAESRLRPKKLEISQIFNEEFFKEKYLLYVTL
ncbi:MAG TPA: RsmG family class I SAM-dependent methyltransferase, partial [Chitinophagaceae bacterium]|nr:RsmG family class I SAM-dependent methyltransferase [Chitinophagaceae bacterium]